MYTPTGRSQSYRRSTWQPHRQPQSRSYHNRAPGRSTIDPQRFVNQSAVRSETATFAPQHSFVDFQFSSQLSQNIKAAGYELPTAVQDQTIPAILAGKDVLGLADTGSGKTAAFVLPILQQLQQSYNRPGVLVIAPTRELAEQIEKEFYQFGKNLNIYSVLCVGGMSMGRQIAGLRRRPHIVVGTPGRLKDLTNRQILDLSQVKTFVLDEIDRMLDMGFMPDIRYLVGKLPQQRQSLGFSATMTPAIESLLNQILKQPQTVSVRSSQSSDHIAQDIVRVRSSEHKLELLHEMLGKPEFTKVLIFGQTKHGVQHLSEKLTKNGHRAEAIHGNKNQSQRQRALKAFKQNEVKVLVATDVAARGLDIPNVSHVINFDQPASYSDYIHRIGRTGRAGQPGQALTFVAGY